MRARLSLRARGWPGILSRRCSDSGLVSDCHNDLWVLRASVLGRTRKLGGNVAQWRLSAGFQPLRPGFLIFQIEWPLSRVKQTTAAYFLCVDELLFAATRTCVANRVSIDVPPQTACLAFGRPKARLARVLKRSLRKYHPCKKISPEFRLYPATRKDRDEFPAFHNRRNVVLLFMSNLDST